MTQQSRARKAGERCTQVTLVRLMCAVSIWRTAMTRLLPLCGTAAWWVSLLCLLPGFGTAALLWLVMHLTRTTTLAEAIRACLGKAGAAAVSVMLTALLLTEGVSGLTALMTLFTQGIGTRGTQLTLAVLTGVILLLSLHREGLARASHLLRWGMAAAALLTAVYLAGDARADHLFPWYGDGRGAVRQGVQAGMSLAWPVVLLLTVPPSKGRGRLTGSVPAVFCTVGGLLLLTIAVPHEVISQSSGVAQALLLPVRFAPNAVRVIAQSLMMLAFFFSIGAAAQLAASSVCLPLRQAPGWLPYGMVGALILTQATEAAILWDALERVGPWLLVPLLVLGGLCLPIALNRRKKG